MGAGAAGRGFSLDDAARAAGASKRTLARRMQSVLGKSPLSYFQSLRVERAVHLLKTSSASVDEVAARVGYADGATLRALLRRRLNRGSRRSEEPRLRSSSDAPVARIEAADGRWSVERGRRSLAPGR